MLLSLRELGIVATCLGDGLQTQVEHLLGGVSEHAVRTVVLLAVLYEHADVTDERLARLVALRLHALSNTHNHVT